MPAIRPLSRSALFGQHQAAELHRVNAPDFIVHRFGWSPPGHIFSTTCRKDEEVVWTWTHTADGSYVSGFTLQPRT